MLITLERKTKHGPPSALIARGSKEELRASRCVYVDPYKKDPPVMPLTPLSLKILRDEGIPAQLTNEVVNWYNKERDYRGNLAAAYSIDAGEASDPRLYDFQSRAVRFITATGGRALLGDDPRLGKTVQSLLAMQQLVPAGPIVIYTLKSLCEYWADAVTQWTNYTPVVVKGSKIARSALLTTKWSKPTALVTNWETLRVVPLKVSIKAKHIIGDEVHVVRNRKSGVGEQFMRLRPEHAILASATMVERGPEDYFALLCVIRPWEFRSYWRYVGWYCQTEFNGFGTSIVGSKNEDLLQDHLAPFALRRKAKDVASVPEKQFETIRIEASPELLEAYGKIAEEVFVEIDQMKLTIPNALARMVRLKQVSTTPRVLGLDFDSPKVAAIAEYIENLPLHTQVLVYTQFRESARQLQAALGADLFIGGEGTYADFVAGRSRVLVTTSQLGGVGLDFSNAQIIIYADLPLSATLLRQSIERTTKIGIKEPRLIVTFACTPIDLATAELLRAKQEAIADVDIYEAILRYR